MSKPLEHPATSEFHYDLPPELIAQTPLPERTDSRLLILTGPEAEHGQFPDVCALLQPGDLLVMNDTRVIKARLHASKDSGGRAEVLLERLLDEHTCLAQVRVSKALQPGRKLRCGAGELEVLDRQGMFYRLRVSSGVLPLFEAAGEVPLPPYIERHADQQDERSYQTVYAREAGAVAAPTAGLHFSEALLASLRDRGVEQAFVTLHVGAGTFSPLRGAAEDHQMHAERFRVPAQTVAAIRACTNRGGRVVAVGTTVVRTLETAAALAGPGANGLQPAAGETQLFIRPGFDFQVVDALITNFHLPDSTLMMLVSAFAGTERTLAAYRLAVAERYRFFSYGDAMFVAPLASAAHV